MAGTEPNVLAELLEVSQTLASSLDMRSALGRVLEHIEQSLGAVSATVALREGEADDLVVEAAVGIGWQKARRARYKAGEGITGRVVASGRPVVVPEVSREPLFLNRTGVLGSHGKGELTYLCAPVTVSG